MHPAAGSQPRARQRGGLHRSIAGRIRIVAARRAHHGRNHCSTNGCAADNGSPRRSSRDAGHAGGGRRTTYSCMCLADPDRQSAIRRSRDGKSSAAQQCDTCGRSNDQAGSLHCISPFGWTKCDDLAVGAVRLDPGQGWLRAGPLADIIRSLHQLEQAAPLLRSVHRPGSGQPEDRLD